MAAETVYTIIGFLFLVAFVIRQLNAGLAKRAAAASKSGYFAPHLQRLQYDELAEMYSPQDGYGSKILTSALLRRAMVDVQRIMQFKDEKPSTVNLVRSGVLGEEILEKMNVAEKELEAEIQDCVEEAELYKPGWGKSIFQDASNYMSQQAQAAQAQAQALAQAKAQTQGQSRPQGKEAATSPSELTAEEKEERARIAAQELLEEEERERKKNAGGGNKKNNKNKRK